MINDLINQIKKIQGYRGCPIFQIEESIEIPTVSSNSYQRIQLDVYGC